MGGGFDELRRMSSVHIRGSIWVAFLEDIDHILWIGWEMAAYIDSGAQNNNADVCMILLDIDENRLFLCRDFTISAVAYLDTFIANGHIQCYHMISASSEGHLRYGAIAM